MNPTILVIDDNSMMRTFLSHLFGKKYQIVVKESAEAALLWLDEHDSPSLIISDYDLEGISGFDLLKQLQASENTRKSPVAILSGKSKSEHRIECLEAGAVDFIVKPFNPEELALRVDRLVEEASKNTSERMA